MNDFFRNLTDDELRDFRKAAKAEAEQRFGSTSADSSVDLAALNDVEFALHKNKVFRDTRENEHKAHIEREHRRIEGSDDA